MGKEEKSKVIRNEKETKHKTRQGNGLQKAGEGGREGEDQPTQSRAGWWEGTRLTAEW